jgi:hypothetical protein
MLPPGRVRVLGRVGWHDEGALGAEHIQQCLYNCLGASGNEPEAPIRRVQQEYVARSEAECAQVGRQRLNSVGCRLVHSAQYRQTLKS